VVHFRGCSGEPNRLPRAYHSGDSAEIDWVVRRLHARGYPALFLTGVSLGGNAMLKWLAEQGAEACSLVDAAVAISAPLDLAAANTALSSASIWSMQGTSCAPWFRRRWKRNAAFPGRIDVRRTVSSRTLRDFDDAVTAPLHGFQGADDYYARSSAGPLLSTVMTPTLLLNAANDPFLPRTALPLNQHLPPAVTLEVPEHGGHVGFVHGVPPGRIDWLAQRILAHCDANLSHSFVVR
jgi:predicted alpha/beta-fold hydrolase